MAGWARPVLMPANSSFATETALSIFSSASKSVSSITSAPVLLAIDPCPARSHPLPAFWIPGAAHQCADLLTPDRPDNVAGLHQGENDDRQAVIHAQADRGGVHHLQPAAEYFGVVELVVLDRVRCEPRVGVVDAVHLGALQNGLGADLQRPLGGGGVGGEERRAETGAEDHDPPLLQMPDRPARNVRSEEHT